MSQTEVEVEQLANKQQALLQHQVPFWPLSYTVYIHVINATIDKGSIVWVPRMKVVWEPRIIIDNYDWL